MIVSKANAGNAAIGSGVATVTVTTGLSWLELISIHSVAIGLGISVMLGVSGLAINFYFKYQDLKETKRHNRRLEELTAQSNNVKG